jgi:hypothetical protein
MEVGGRMFEERKLGCAVERIKERGWGERCVNVGVLAHIYKNEMSGTHYYMYRLQIQINKCCRQLILVPYGSSFYTLLKYVKELWEVHGWGRLN